MIVSSVDNITQIKNSSNNNNNDILFEETLTLLKTKTKTYNNNLPFTKFLDKTIIYFHINVNHPLRNFIGSFPFFLLIDNDIDIQITKDNSITIGTNSQYNKTNENDNYYIHSSTSKFEPVEYDFSRYILSLYSVVYNKNYDNTIPFYCYCKKISKNNKNSLNKFYLGIHHEISSSNVGRFYITEIMNNGTFQYNKDIKENKFELQISNILNNTYSQDDIINNKVKGYITSTYDILNYNDNVSNSSTIKLKATWENIQNLLSKPSSSADISLFINCYNGEIDQKNHILTQNLLRELHKLEEWNRIRKGEKWITTQPLNISHKVDSFLNSIKDESYTKSSTDKIDEKLQNLNISSILVPRKNLDFTDKLWTFLINSSSSKDLNDAFTVILEELETFRLQPMVNKSNTSKFANVIRSCIKIVHTQTSSDIEEQKEAILETFNLWQKQPMDCLVDIGIWKLKRDYCHYLIENELISLTELEPFIDSSLELDEQINNLKILHRITELWVLISNQIHSMPHEINRKIVQKVARELKNNHHKLPDNMKFIVNFPSINSNTIKIVNSLTKCFKPSSWTIKIINNENNNTLTNSFKKKNPIIIYQLCKEENENNLFMEDNNANKKNDISITKSLYSNSCYRKISAKQMPFM